MSKLSHDDNFKNMLQDFPEESLEVFFPQAQAAWGKVLEVSFERQEPRKHHLADPGLRLDIPILFTFARHKLLLWLVEFQEDKQKFSIHRLLRYTTDLMEAHPDAVVVPTVLFTESRNWHKDVLRQLESRIAGRTFVHFEYVYHKLFDLRARDYYAVRNPVVKILLPKMQYDPSERLEVIRQAYTGLYQLVSAALFSKYLHFIDTYADVAPEEQQLIYNALIEQKETAMFSEYIKDLGREEGKKEGKEEGKKEGKKEGMIEMVADALGLKFVRVPEHISARLARISEVEALKELVKTAFLSESLQQFEKGLEDVERRSRAAREVQEPFQAAQS